RLRRRARRRDLRGRRARRLTLRGDDNCRERRPDEQTANGCGRAVLHPVFSFICFSGRRPCPPDAATPRVHDLLRADDRIWEATSQADAASSGSTCVRHHSCGRCYAMNVAGGVAVRTLVAWLTAALVLMLPRPGFPQIVQPAGVPLVYQGGLYYPS